MFNTEKLNILVTQITRNLPKETLFNDQDAATLQQHQAVLLQLGPDMVFHFYETIFKHDKTREIFAPNERPAREHDFTKWWQKSITGPFNQEYWAWQAFVGVIHVKREVDNSMMTSMWSWMLNYTSEQLHDKVDYVEFGQIMRALQRLSSTCLSLAEDTYIKTYLKGILKATGFKQALLDRMVKNEIDAMIDGYKISA